MGKGERGQAGQGGQGGQGKGDKQDKEDKGDKGELFNKSLPDPRSPITLTNPYSLVA
jgi:hypothetical protein